MAEQIRLVVSAGRQIKRKQRGIPADEQDAPVD